MTPEILEDGLRALRSGKPLSLALLDALGLHSLTDEEYAVAFETRLHDLAWAAYAGLRRLEGLPAEQPRDRQEALQMVAKDSAAKNGSLAAWSALYFRYLAGMHFSVQELAQAASVVPQQFRRRLKQGLTLLAREIARSRQGKKRTPASQAGLPLPEFTALVGVEQQLELLARLFADPDGPRLVSLEGLGGIGKSALARAFIGRPDTAGRWSKIAWVSARQAALTDDGRLSPAADAATTLDDITARLCSQLGIPSLAAGPLEQRIDGLKTVLGSEKHLIVVDNLETVEDYLSLVPTLGRLAGSSRFLITIRQTLRDFAYVYTIPVKELNRQNAFDVIAAENARRGRGSRPAISPENFEELYQVVGGHPLALKLVAAQLYLRPLSEILAAFRQAKVGIDQLYHYLYWQAWRAMSDPARRALLSFLPSDPEGEDLAFLQLMSGEDEETFYAAIRELDSFSLLEVNGDIERLLYRLHSLTITFLQTDILRLWDGDTND